MTGIELRGLKSLKGLDGLLQDTKQIHPDENKFLLIEIGVIRPGKYQPRTEFDEETVYELAESIKANGIIQPLIVRKIENNLFEIIAGERRWRAAKLAGLTEVPAILRDVPDGTALAFALIENIQRVDLNPIDQATALLRLKTDFSLTHEEIAARVGRSRSAVTNLIRLTTLCSEVQELLRARKLEMGHARALLTLDDQRQIEVAKKIVAKQLSVRAAEKIAQADILSSSQSYVTDIELENKIQLWTEILTNKFSSPVNVQLNKKGEGKVVIQVSSVKEIEWLVKHIQVE
ncbi:ParB/RepB/Spo0J family partition protein [soil metagenome]